MEFTLGKLRCCGNYQGLYVLRCSPREYDKYYLSFVVGVGVRRSFSALNEGAVVTAALVLQSDSAVDYKHCQIVRTEDGQFLLSGAQRSCGSVRELLHCYKKEALRTDGYTFQLTRGCPPSLKGQRSGGGAVPHAFPQG